MELHGFLILFGGRGAVEFFTYALGGSLFFVGMIYYVLVVSSQYRAVPVRLLPRLRIIFQVLFAVFVFYLLWRVFGKALPWPALRPPV